MSPDQTASLPEQARSTNGLPPLSDLLNRQRRAGESRTLLFGNGLSLRARLPFTAEQINHQAAGLNIGPRATALLQKLPKLMPEDALRYLRGYPLTYDETEMSEYKLLRDAFAPAVALVHPRDQAGLQVDTLSLISEFFIEFDALFTTNYDLLGYWAMMTDPARAYTTDLFAPHPAPESERRWILQYGANHFSNRIPFRYLHGALHLARRGSIIEKFSRTRLGVPLIHQIRQRIKAGKLPMIVVEGSANRKLRRIQENPYLEDSYAVFCQLAGALVIYGWGFNLQDRHLVDAILRNQNLMEIWISMYGEVDSEENREMRARIDRRRAKAEQSGCATPAKIIYYDADSVPF